MNAPPSQKLLWKLCSDHRVPERDWVLDVHAADRVDDGRQAVEVDRDPVVDLQAGHLGEDRDPVLARLVHPARVPTDGERLVDLRVLGKSGCPSTHRSRGTGIMVVVLVLGSIDRTMIESAR